ncbi:MFS transporter [Nonomuraea wenchangensis]|uniref:Major Facilitator Superfamily protein n=1 Tax=Nonomuraea wenchangensis TaxID=568860 RepID=A0A1I0AA43_9ACTN|nr:MFS transporter [Nonomuraea wenchangensis]SES91067.1 Major Facilitator Superfamily protein [Nonomuraea wenchangensis]
MNEISRGRAAVTMIFAVHGAALGAFATRIPWIRDQLELDPVALGAALVAPAISACFTMPMSGRVTRWLGSRRAITLMSVLFSLALIPPVLATSLPLLWLALLAYGAATGIADVAMNAGGVDVERRHGRSIMSGLHGSWSVGGLFGSGLGALATWAGMDARLHLTLMAALLVAVSIASGRHLLDVRPPAREATATGGFVWPARAAMAIGLVGFCAQFAQGAAGNWSAIYLEDIAGASAGIAAASFTAFSCTMGIVRFCGDRLVGRWGTERVIRYSGAVSVAGGLLIVMGRDPAPAIAGFALLGIGIAVVVPLAFASAGHHGDEPNRSIAGVATVTYLSNLVAPAAVGAIAGATSLETAFLLVTLLLGCVVAGARAFRAPASATHGEAHTTAERRSA